MSRAIRVEALRATRQGSQSGRPPRGTRRAVSRDEAIRYVNNYCKSST